MVQEAKRNPLPHNQILTLRPLKPTNSILVTGLPEHADDFYVKLFFNNLGCSVQEVTLRPPNHAVVTFTDHQSKFAI